MHSNLVDPFEFAGQIIFALYEALHIIECMYVEVSSTQDVHRYTAALKTGEWRGCN